MCNDILAEGGAQGGLTNRNYGVSLFSDASTLSKAIEVMDKKLSLTEEENAVGELAKYMTLMNLFEDKEEYEKCAVCKLKIDNVNKILEKY